jgi:hypothetical protein
VKYKALHEPCKKKMTKKLKGDENDMHEDWSDNCIQKLC